MGIFWLLYCKIWQAHVQFKDNELAITWYVHLRVAIYFLELYLDALLLSSFSTIASDYAHSVN